jgi:WD40 repeat protein
MLTLSAPPGPVKAASLSPDGSVMAFAVRNDVVLMDIGSSRIKHTIRGQRGDDVIAVAFSPDGKRVVSGGHAARPKLWDVESGDLIRTFVGHNCWVSSLAFSPSGSELISAGIQNELMLWDVERGRLIRTFSRKKSSPLYSVAFSPDGTQLAWAGSDGTVDLWDVANDRLIRTFLGKYADYVFSISFSPDGTKLAAAIAGEVLVWQTESGARIHTLDGGPALAFSRNGKRLAAWSKERRVKIWEMESWRAVCSLPQARVFCLMFSPDDSQIFAVESDSPLRLWNIAADGERVYEVVVKPPVGMSRSEQPFGIENEALVIHQNGSQSKVKEGVYKALGYKPPWDELPWC